MRNMRVKVNAYEKKRKKEVFFFENKAGVSYIKSCVSKVEVKQKCKSFDFRL